MMFSRAGDCKTWILRAVCIYSVIAGVSALVGEIKEFKALLFFKDTSNLGYLLFTALMVGIQLLGAAGLWMKRRWAFAVLLFFYLIQSFALQDKIYGYYFVVGPHFFVNFKLSFEDGLVILGFNLIPIAILFLLLIGCTQSPTSNDRREPGGVPSGARL